MDRAIVVRAVRLLGYELSAVCSAWIEHAADTLTVNGGERASAGDAGDHPAFSRTRKCHFNISNQRAGE
jgi:hypothetical protein